MSHTVDILKFIFPNNVVMISWSNYIPWIILNFKYLNLNGSIKNTIHEQFVEARRGATTHTRSKFYDKLKLSIYCFTI